MSPVGIGTQANWDALCAGTSGIGPITRFDATGFATRFAGEVKGFDPLQFIEKKELKKMDIFIQFAVAASQFAMDDSGLTVTPEIADRVGVFIASGIGGFTTIEREHRALLEGGPRKISPFFIPSAIINLAAGQVSIRFGAKGPNLGHLHGVHGLGARHRRCVRDHQARRRRRDDRRRHRGGRLPDGRRRLRRHARAVDAQRRPGARQPAVRQGPRRLRAGRGRGHPGARGARDGPAPRRAHLRRDGGLRHVGRRVPHDRPVGRRRRRGPRDAAAIESAGIAPSDVDYINAHGTSTPHNDRIETTAIKRVFGDHAYKLAISSTKSMTGHLLGAAGGLEAGITALSVFHQKVPPTINLDHPDEGCDLDYVPHVAREMPIDYALSNSFGFGGTNGALLFKKYEA